MEDDPEIQDVTVSLLSKAGFDVRAFGSAEAALLEARAFDPELILLDVMLPGLDGKDAFAAFRAMPATAATPVIFMTARVESLEIRSYRQLGCLGVIRKPFDADTLVATTQEMWDLHQEDRVDEIEEQDLDALRKLYATDLPDRLREIEAAAKALRDEGWDSHIAASVYETAHRLVGSAAIYGFLAVSEAAGRIGVFATEHPPEWKPADARPLLELLDALSAALRESPAANAPESSDQLASRDFAGTPAPSAATRRGRASPRPAATARRAQTRRTRSGRSGARRAPGA